MTGVILDRQHTDHCPEESHPERPERLAQAVAVAEAAAAAGHIALVDSAPIEPAVLPLIHDESYLAQLDATRRRSVTYLDEDTPAGLKSYGAALRAAGAVCLATETVWSGELSNSFALIRPLDITHSEIVPGAFVLLNNVALAAAHARRNLGVDRILIVDWDAHHGNGIQDAFLRDPSILYFSTHQWPAYPGTGGFEERGDGPGLGRTVNIPLWRWRNDADYLELYRQLLPPIVREFRPDLILVAAGFDAHREDPLASMEMTAGGFGALTTFVRDLAVELCDGRLVLSLEGGYEPTALGRSFRAVLDALTGERRDVTIAGSPSQQARDAIRNARYAYGGYWRSLRTGGAVP